MRTGFDMMIEQLEECIAQCNKDIAKYESSSLEERYKEQRHVYEMCLNMAKLYRKTDG